MASIGIDYGMGQSNRNLASGIRLGVISVNSLAGWVAGEAEPIYPDSVDIECPECKQTFSTSNLCPDDDQTCPNEDCEHAFPARELDYLEPIGWDYAQGDSKYKTESSESLNAVFVTESPYYTYARFCSPCAPGALDLDSPVDRQVSPSDGEWHADSSQPRAYCFGHEYFEDGKAPYKVFSVADDSEVLPDGD